MKKTASIIILFLACLLTMPACKPVKNTYSNAVKQFEAGFDIMERIATTEKVTEKNVEAAIKEGGKLFPVKLEEIYNLSLEEKKEKEFNSLWLRKVMFKYIGLLDKIGKRAGTLNEEELRIYGLLAQSIREDAVYLWRNYFPDDRHIYEELYPRGN